MVEEIKCIQSNFPEIPLAEILQWSTLNGAEALAQHHWLGSFTPGKKPGVVLIDNIDFENMKLTPQSRSKRII
jgi:imidazolonepropionase-like amidohydrolase